MAVLPTASAPEGATYADWANQGLRHYDRLGVRARLIEVRGRQDADRAVLARELDRVSLIFFSGRDPAYLARVLEGTAVWAAVLAAVERGAAFVGCSAGACVAGAFAPDSMTEHIWEDRWRAGLALLPDVWVLPHFDMIGRAVRRYFLSTIPADACVLGVDEQTAVVRIGSRWTIAGTGGAFLRRGDVAFRAGLGCSFDLESPASRPARVVDPEVVAALDPLPADVGAIGVLFERTVLGREPRSRRCPTPRERSPDRSRVGGRPVERSPDRRRSARALPGPWSGRPVGGARRRSR